MGSSVAGSQAGVPVATVGSLIGGPVAGMAGGGKPPSALVDATAPSFADAANA